MISYAQNFEDIILERFFKDKINGFYVDVGAAKPTLDSVTKHFYEKGWTGINIEPSTFFYNELVLERKRDICLNISISNIEGSIEFYDLPNTGLSSTNEEIVQSAFAGNNIYDYDGNKIDAFEKCIIQSKRLESVFEQYAKNIEIDFLKIDVEGTERNVIESNNWNIYRPKVLVIEATIPNSQEKNHKDWEHILIEANYTFVYFDGLNRFYLRNDQMDNKSIFSYPPCFFDNFILYSEVYKQVQIGELLGKNNVIQQQYQVVTQTLNSIKHSYSWRLTLPLRLIERKLKDLLKNG